MHLLDSVICTGVIMDVCKVVVRGTDLRATALGSLPQ